MVYFVISSYIFPIGIGLALLILKRLPFVGGTLCSYLLFTFLVEIMTAVLANQGINTLWLYRVYLYAELVFPTLLFFNQFSKKRSRSIIFFAFSVTIILTTLTNVFDDWRSNASIQVGITFCYVTFIIISYFVEMFRSEKVFNPFREVYFVVGGTLLLGNSCTLIYNVLYDYLASGYFGSEIHSILNGVNLGLIIFYNILYSYALWISRLPQT